MKQGDAGDVMTAATADVQLRDWLHSQDSYQELQIFERNVTTTKRSITTIIGSCAVQIKAASTAVSGEKVIPFTIKSIS